MPEHWIIRTATCRSTEKDDQARRPAEGCAEALDKLLPEQDLARGRELSAGAQCMDDAPKRSPHATGACWNETVPKHCDGNAARRG